MSEDNIIKITRLEEQMKGIEKKVDEGFSSLKEDNARVENLILDFMEKSEKKFANKWVENAVSWAGYTVVGAVIMALLYLVVQSGKLT